MSCLLRVKCVQSPNWSRLLFVLLAALLLSANSSMSLAQDDDHESVGSSGSLEPVEADDDDAEAESAEAAEEGEGLVEESFDGSTGGGELESVSGFAPSVIEEVEAEVGEEFGEEITPYEELLNLPSIESLLGGMDPDTRSEVFEQPESVCGKDQRVRISPTTRNPWRWNCKLIITLRSGGKAHATGFLIGPGTVMTAGHCVHQGKGGNSGWYKRLEVIPGMDARKRPYGTYFSSNLRSVKGWTNKGKSTHDYGAIILRQKPGIKTGYFGYAAYSSSTLKNMLVNTAGYPADKPLGTQWFMAGRINKVESRRIHYMIDTYGGQSGSSVWRLTKGNRYAVGIHAYGGCPNKATRIVKPVFDNMKKWRAQGK